MNASCHGTKLPLLPFGFCSKVCKSTTCDQSCAAFHAAAVDEIVDHLFLDVWARQWGKLSGGKAKATEDDLFQAFVRMPSSALPHVFKAVFSGLYIEPRAADGSGPHSSWAVVWLPGKPQPRLCTC